MKITALVILLSIFSFAGKAQSGLTTLSLPPAGRYDDIFFVNDSMGWVVGSRFGNVAKIFATKDGGDTWKEQFAVNQYLRSIEFINEKTGFCGSLDSTLYKTTDGGQTWKDITASVPVRPQGICGLNIPDVNTIYGVGKYSGPAFIIKSADGGNTWSYINMSSYADGLVDVYFLNKDSGFVTGFSNTKGGVILYTADGGATWAYKFTTLKNGDVIWKIQTPDNINFYASVEALPYNRNSRYLQSANSGSTWRNVIWSGIYDDIQGIGFIDTQVGWMGGSTKLYKTTNGGLDWHEDNFKGPFFDRFCRINNKIAFLSGQQVYKYNALTAGDNGNTKPNNIHYLSVLPNPSKGVIKILSVFKYPTHAIVSIYGDDGTLTAQLLNQNVNEGSRTISYNLSNNAAGIYYVILQTNEGMIYKKMVKQ
jgi:photosystem II stability/assembly factor-like uncharacterized protein